MRPLPIPIDCGAVPGRNQGGNPIDESVGQRRGKVEPALLVAKAFLSTRRTKVCANGTVRKIWT